MMRYVGNVNEVGVEVEIDVDHLLLVVAHHRRRAATSMAHNRAVDSAGMAVGRHAHLADSAMHPHTHTHSTHTIIQHIHVA